MINELLLLPDVVFLLMAASLIYFAAGIVKGLLGIGFPTAAVSLLAQATDARTAITVVVIPMLITNLWQVYRSSDVLYLARRFWPLIVCMLIFIAAFSQIASRAPISALTAILGVVVSVYALHSLYSKPWVLGHSLDRPAQCLAGILAGIMGGLVSVWAPPLLIYLRSKALEKDQFVSAIGLFLLAGSCVLLISHMNSGVLAGGLLWLSWVLVLPAIAGFGVGELLRKRISANKFDRLLLWFFLIMGLNLIRRAVF